MREIKLAQPNLLAAKFPHMKETISILSYVLLAMLLFSACKKERLDADSPQNPEKEKLIIMVKSWLDNQKNGLLVSDTRKIESLKGSLDYNKLRLERYRDLEKFIVVPISNEFKSQNNQDKNPVNYLVLVLNSQDSIANGNIIQYISSNGQKVAPESSFYKIFSYQNLDCSGQFTVLSVTDYFRYELKFENGKLKSVANQRKKTAPNSDSGKANGCIEWYLVTTYYWLDGTSTTTWDYLFTACDDGDCAQARVANGRSFRANCSGGGGGGDNTESCINSFSDGTTSSETVSISTSNEDPTYRTKIYIWTFFKSNGNVWRFNSTETGIHKKVNNEWRWHSLIHNDVSREGLVIGGDVRCTSVVATPTLGIYNAAMTLNFNIQYSIVCVGFPVTTNHNFVATKYFNIND